MTSDDEGLPITVLEAVAQGILVVSTDVGGIPELLEGRGEVLSPEDSVKTRLADTLLKVIEVPCKVLKPKRVARKEWLKSILHSIWQEVKTMTHLF